MMRQYTYVMFIFYVYINIEFVLLLFSSTRCLGPELDDPFLGGDLGLLSFTHAPMRTSMVCMSVVAPRMSIGFDNGGSRVRF